MTVDLSKSPFPAVVKSTQKVKHRVKDILKERMNRDIVFEKTWIVEVVGLQENEFFLPDSCEIMQWFLNEKGEKCIIWEGREISLDEYETETIPF